MKGQGILNLLGMMLLGSHALVERDTGRVRSSFHRQDSTHGLSVHGEELPPPVDKGDGMGRARDSSQWYLIDLIKIERKVAWAASRNRLRSEIQLERPVNPLWPEGQFGSKNSKLRF